MAAAAAAEAEAEAATVEIEVARNLLDVGNKLRSPPSDVEELLKLLNLAEDFLSQVEQAPPTSLNTALYRVLKALVAQDLLNHSEMDVKIALASCFSEITFITAPAHPYNEDLMKDIFRIIVDALKNIDDSSSRTYYKKVSILETIAKVHSCVLMLDLDCDDLILEMFQHFLKTITFYEGVVESFDPISKKHKVSYFDGDEEILFLKVECWKFLKDDTKPEFVWRQQKENPGADASPNVLSVVKGKDPIWEHCERVAGNGRWTFKCFHCSKIVSDLGRMKHHLARTGNGIVKPCTHASQEVEKLFREMVSRIKPRWPGIRGGS